MVNEISHDVNSKSTVNKNKTSYMEGHALWVKFLIDHSEICEDMQGSRLCAVEIWDGELSGGFEDILGLGFNKYIAGSST